MLHKAHLRAEGGDVAGESPRLALCRRRLLAANLIEGRIDVESGVDRVD